MENSRTVSDPMPPSATDLIIILKPESEWKSGRTYDELGDAIEEKIAVIPGIIVEKSQPIQMRFNELMTGIKQDVAIKIFGENLDTLALNADKVSKVIQTVKGVTVPQVELVSGLPQINIEYDRTRLANYGVNVEDVNNVVSTAFAGKSAGVVFENERRFDLVVRLDSTYRGSIEDVNNMMIPTNIGSQIRQYEYYRNQAIPNAEKIVKAAQLGYRTGEISYMEYLFALQTATNIQLKSLEAIQKVNESVININALINQ